MRMNSPNRLFAALLVPVKNVKMASTDIIKIRLSVFHEFLAFIGI